MLRVNLKSPSPSVRRISLATLKWRDRKEKPTMADVDAMIIDLDGDKMLRRLQLRSFAYSLLDDKDLAGYRRGTNHEPFAAPVRTCADIFYTLSGFIAALDQGGRIENNKYWKRVFKSKLMADEDEGKLDYLTAKVPA